MTHLGVMMLPASTSSPASPEGDEVGYHLGYNALRRLQHRTERAVADNDWHQVEILLRHQWRHIPNTSATRAWRCVNLAITLIVTRCWSDARSLINLARPCIADDMSAHDGAVFRAASAAVLQECQATRVMAEQLLWLHMGRDGALRYRPLDEFYQ